VTRSKDDRGLSVLDRLALSGGAAFAVLMLVGNGLTEADAPTEESPAAAHAYFALLRTGSHRLGLGMELLGLSLLVVFLAKLHAVLRDAEGPRSWLPQLALSGGLVTVAVKLATASTVLVGLAVEDLPGEQALLVQRLGDAGFLVSAITSGLLVLGAAGSALASGVLPRWFAGLGLAVGLLAVLGSLAPSSLDGTPGVAGFLLGLLWVLVTSVLLAARRSGAAAAAGHEAVLTPA
jgi:hypothetical protein